MHHPQRGLFSILIALLLVGAIGASSGLSASAAPDDSAQLMVVLDSSGSMASPDQSGVPKIDAARQSLTGLFSDLPATTPVGLRVLGATVAGETMPANACQDTQRVVDVGVDNRPALLEAIGAYHPYGWTPIPEALQQAAADLGNSGRRAIILVSDGESTCGDPCPVATSIAQSGVDITIDVVGLAVDEATRQQLQCIAENANGRYYDAGNSGELSDALQQVTKDREIRPFGYDGTPVTGTAEPARAPVVTAGTFLDTIPATGEPSATLTRHYTIKRTMPDSDISAAAFLASTLAEARSLTGFNVQVSIMAGDKSCTMSGSSEFGQNKEFFMQAGILTTPNALDDSCYRAEQLTVAVKLKDIDLTSDRQLQLQLGEWPGIANVDAQEEAFEAQGELSFGTDPVLTDGEAPLIEGGSTLASGTLVQPNTTYSAAIVPGEIQTFRVPLAWGQAVRVLVGVPGLSAEMGRALGSGEPPKIAGHVLSATGQELTSASSYCRLGVAGCQAVGIDQPIPVRAKGSDTAKATQPGMNSIVIGLTPAAGLTGVEVPYRFMVQVVGAVLPGPQYQSHSASATPTANETPAASTSAEQTSPANQPSTTAPQEGLSTGSVVAIGVLGVLVLGGLVAVVLMRRRTRR